MSTEDLERVIGALDTLYYLGEPCIHPDTGELVSDSEYEKMRTALRKLHPNSPLLSTPTASSIAASGVPIVEHNPPMVSISKAVGTQREKEFIKWQEGCKKELGNCKFTQAFKLDGVALRLYYEKGKLIKSGLRPNDGIHGEDVTQNAKYVENVPQQLPEPYTLSVSGEVICLKSDFRRINNSSNKNYANPRNFAAGSMRLFKNPLETKKRKLKFVAHSVEWMGKGKQPFKTEIERAKWCAKRLKIQHIQVRPFRFKDLAIMEITAPNFDYEVDGVVVSVENLEDAEQLGQHGNSPTGNPRGKIAWKFSDEKAFPIVKEIQWSTGRTKKIVPVAVFDPVNLAGTTVEKATCHNVGFLQRLEIGPGAKIQIIKSGKIIPKVVEVLEKSNNVTFPTHCPSCNTVAKIKYGGKDANGNVMKELICCNSTDCSAQSTQYLEYYLKTIGVKGIGPNIISLLNGLVYEPADFYKLDENSLLSVGMTMRQTLLTLANVHMVAAPSKIKENSKLQEKLNIARSKKKKLPLWKFLASLGIMGVGNSTARILASHFGSLNAIKNASMARLQEVEDVGEITAKDIYDFFAKPISVNNLLNLLEHIQPETPTKGGSLSGKTFVFTGSLPGGKAFWKEKVEKQGGNISGSVSAKTDYVVVGSDPGSKKDKANQLGITTISVNELEKMI